MQIEERIKMFKDVFKPMPNEKVLFLVDVPHDNIKDTDKWKRDNNNKGDNPQGCHEEGTRRDRGS